MTSIRLTNAAETWAPDDFGAPLTGAPAGPANDPLPPIDAKPGLIRTASSRRAIPDFDGESGEPLDAVAADIADLVREAEDVAYRDGRPWPDIRPLPRRRADEPAPPKDDARHELAGLRAEIAALKETKQKQNAALELARETLTQQEKETALAKQALRRADEEKAALQAKLQKTNANFAELLRQTAGLNADFDEREKEIAAAEARVATLKAQLSDRSAGDTDLAAAIEEAKARYYRDFTRRCGEFEGELEKLAKTVGVRDERIRKLEDDNKRLAARCDALARKALDLDTANWDAQEKLKLQTATVTFLDATLRTERDAAARKIAQLVADLEHERLERATDAHEAAVVCKEIVGLLPRLAQRSSRSLESLERAVRAAANASAEQRPMTASS